MERIERAMECCIAEGDMTLLYWVPLSSAVITGAGIIIYLIYLTSEYHDSARQRRTPKA
jgi:hypothetical protein